MSSNLEITRKACVVGWPIAHSRSPIIHNFWLRSLALRDLTSRSRWRRRISRRFAHDLAANGFVGANVTIPHKQTAFEVCGKVTPTAASLGAVNTLWLEHGALCGDNTDVAGFLAALDEEAPGWDTASGDAVVLGAGGAARAVVHALRHRGKRVLLANRTQSAGGKPRR